MPEITLETIGGRLAAAAAAAGAEVEPPQVSEEMAEELLLLAAAVAHRGARRQAPLSTYLAGQAVTQAQSHLAPDALLAMVREVREQIESTPSVHPGPGDGT
ncbi:MAG TPA: DUF6457 domain-containing protein [Candidatus Nitrosotalea sp.]|nr:DUF6457 domain-containing protein [Candidatus Nitrosotalea sp.]